MVPLDKVLEKRVPSQPRRFLPPKPPARTAPTPAAEPAPAAPRRFRVVDVLSGEPLAADASPRETVDLLKGLRSVVDVNVYMFEPDDEDWRLLTLREQRALWALRDR